MMGFRRTPVGVASVLFSARVTRVHVSPDSSTVDHLESPLPASPSLVCPAHPQPPKPQFFVSLQGGLTDHPWKNIAVGVTAVTLVTMAVRK